MEPKFQSSFIPKGPLVTTAAGVPKGPKAEKSLLNFLALIIFIISVLLAAGMFGYKLYLNYSIDRMGVDLEQARATLQSETIQELTRLNNRIISTGDLISKHQILTPLFEFLEVSTPRTVRFNDFSYSMSDQGLEINMGGEARGYAALALQADIFSKSQYFKEPIFSNLNLNESGDVNFTFKAIVDPSLVSYQRKVERIGAPPLAPAATSTNSTTTPEDGQVNSPPI